MTGKDAHSLTLQGVPNIACPVVVASEKDPTRDRECNGCDTTQDVIMSERIEFTVSSDIEQTARRIVRPSGKSIAIREEANYW